MVRKVASKLGRIAALGLLGSVAVVLGPACDFGGPLTNGSGADGEADTGEGSDTPCGPSTGFVKYVVDGDTVVLDSGERVRYLLVDTPEITGGKNECWGQEASTYNASLVSQQTVTLTYDVECEDQYGRLLAYVSVGELDINRQLLEFGHACVLQIPPNGYERVSEYRGFEAAAKQGAVGMWGACATVACD